MILTVAVNGMKFNARHGLLPQERTVGNDFEVSVSVDIVTDEQAMLSDSMDASVNYADISDIIRRVMQDPCGLIETVAARIRRTIVDAYPSVVSGVVTVKKLTPPIPSSRMESASVALKWP